MEVIEQLRSGYCLDWLCVGLCLDYSHYGNAVVCTLSSKYHATHNRSLNPGTCQQACRIIQLLEATVQLYHSNHMNLVFILHSWYVMKPGKIIMHLNTRLCAWVYFLLETSYSSDPDHAKHTHQSRVAHAHALVLYYRATSTCTPHCWLAWSMSMSMCNISRISKRNK